MKKIDRETVAKILDAADIVDVVGDFVHLKRSGANYMGLCPFHNERTPSFSVSKSKNICKCFSCGKGGSPVNFIMELEQLSYYEALRYLAKKYHIEVKEHEMSDKEREEASDRESMLAVNEFALRHFEDNLTATDDGREIGLTYFTERGLSETSIKKFHLGYSLERSNELYNSAIAKGYNEKFLIETGLCIKHEQGRVYDRFKGRVMFPVFSVSGKVIAFGGRTLKKDMAKYVNSPESLIYKKSNELYGLYQAKQAIVRQDKCILVEGYMDVISMHQSGIENVVASSGTSLTEGQIRLIHRFTENVTVIYDGDAAGIKASLRGIDMLLSEGLNIKVLLLPDGEDPDSFAQSHSASELAEYITANEVDFMRFKTATLLQGLENDPIRRAKVIGDIVKSISVIPDSIMRHVYIKECSRTLDIDEKILGLQVAKLLNERVEKDRIKQQKAEATESLTEQDSESNNLLADGGKLAKTFSPENNEVDESASFLEKHEREVLRYALKYGMVVLGEGVDADGNPVPVNVLDYIANELIADEISFCIPIYDKVFKAAISLSQTSWNDSLRQHEEAARQERSAYIAKGLDDIRTSAVDLNSIEVREKELMKSADVMYNNTLRAFAMLFLEKELTSHPDDEIRNTVFSLVSEKYVLSKVHTKYSKIELEEDKLAELVPRAIYELKDAILECHIRKLRSKIREVSSDKDCDKDLLESLIKQNCDLVKLKSEFAKYLGERIVAPRK